MLKDYVVMNYFNRKFRLWVVRLSNLKQEAHGLQSSPELQFIIAITCVLDWHDDLCMVDLKLHNSTRGPMVL